MRHAQFLDVPFDHGPGERGRLEQVARRLGDQPALADTVNHVTSPAHALQPAGDVARRLDLADQVDIPHVDAQLERGRRHHATKRAGLEPFLGRPALFQAQAAVVGAEPSAGPERLPSRIQ